MVSWTDELWEEVWERTLGHVERHHIARDVWRRQLPDDLLHRRVAPELARRWRRTARNLAILYGLWSLFWGAIAVTATPQEGDPAAHLPIVLTVLGFLAVGGCAAVRRRVAPIARLQL